MTGARNRVRRCGILCLFPQHWVVSSETTQNQGDAANVFETAGSSTPRNHDALAEEHIAAVNDEQDDVSEDLD